MLVDDAMCSLISCFDLMGEGGRANMLYLDWLPQPHYVFKDDIIPIDCLFQPVSR